MAETFTLMTGVDAWVSPERNGRFGDTRLFVHSTANAYIYFNRPLLPSGSVVTSAKLRIYPVPTAVATVVPLTIHRLTEPFNPNSLTWGNLPAVGAQVGTQSRQWYPTGGPPFEISITSEVQAIVNGQDWYGWRLSSTGTNVEQAVWGGQSATPILLEVTYTMPPPAPTELWPTGNSTVLSSRPTLQWTLTGGLASTPMAFQVQVAADSGFTTSLYTSNEIAGNASLYDLSAASPAFTALTNGQSRWWRVRVKNDQGVWSPYSDAAQFTYNAAPALAITSPGASTAVPIPTITWTYGGSMAAWQILVDLPSINGEDRVGEIYDSGIQYGSTTTHNLPQGVIRYASPQQYRITLRVWASGAAIVSTTGRPTYQEVQATTAWVPSGAPAPTQIQASQFLAPMPWWTVRWEYTSGTTPTWFLLQMWRNGVLSEYYLSPASVREGATNWYQYTLWSVRARADVTWRVLTITNSGVSMPVPEITMGIRNIMPVVAWATDPGNRRFSLLNANIESNLTEQSDVVQPVHGDPSLVNWSYGLMAGSVVGTISWDAPLDPGSFNAEDMFTDFLFMRKNPLCIIVWQDQAIVAYIYNCTYRSVGRADGKTDWVVSFDFFQVD